MKVEEQDLEDDGPPPGWDSKYQPEPELKPEPEPQSESTPKLLVTGPTTSPSGQSKKNKCSRLNVEKPLELS